MSKTKVYNLLKNLVENYVDNLVRKVMWKFCWKIVWKSCVKENCVKGVSKNVVGQIRLKSKVENFGRKVVLKNGMVQLNGWKNWITNLVNKFYGKFV